MRIERVKWRVKGFQELRKSGAVLAELTERAERVAAASGDGFEARSGEGRTRARASVVTTTVKAMRRPNRMVENLDRGRG